MRLPSVFVCIRRAASLVPVLLVLAASSQSRAQSGHAVYGGSPPSATLTIAVRASVSTSCGFSPDAVPAGTIALGNIDKSFSTDLFFSLRCNAPMRVAVVSSNGGLKAADVPAVPAGYANLEPYNVTLRLAGNAGVQVSSSCASGTLIAAGNACAFRGPASASRGLLLNGPASDVPGSYIRISSPGHTGSNILVASEAYADRLTVTISPAT